MPASTDIWALVVPLSFLAVSVRGAGTACGTMTRAAAGDDLTALREKSFAALRAKCWAENACKPACNNPRSFVTEPHRPRKHTFILGPLSMPFRLDFTVRTVKDAFVALAETEAKESMFAEIDIGGWYNTKSVIRACFSGTTCRALFGGKAVHEEDGILSSEESRPFWVEYREGVVSVGKGGQEEAFLEWDAGAHHGRVPTRVHVGIGSWYEDPGYWLFEFCSQKNN